jgi:hypothetical protein
MKVPDRKTESFIPEALGCHLKKSGLIPKVTGSEDRLPKPVQLEKLIPEVGRAPPLIEPFPEDPGLFRMNKLGTPFL